MFHSSELIYVQCERNDEGGEVKGVEAAGCRTQEVLAVPEDTERS